MGRDEGDRRERGTGYGQTLRSPFQLVGDRHLDLRPEWAGVARGFADGWRLLRHTDNHGQGPIAARLLIKRKRGADGGCAC